ncbi:unnamed protein product [Rotaria sordida]|uniref:Protein kinase domain-containing protein n=1 Tax=Rotaria sordida TaxID=392033 RepID=A0A813V476_9BILA|nr:unnamed protein product [Rotaria sordida]
MTSDSRTDICLSDSVRSKNSESKSTSIRSVLYYLCSTHSDCQNLEEYLGIDKFDVGEPSEEFKNLIKQFTRESKPENKKSQEFDNILKKINPSITFTGDQRGGDFEHLFRGNRPDFTWSINNNFYPWNIVSIIEKKSNIIKQNDISQMLEYLRSIVKVFPERKYAIGCLTNYKRIIFGKVSIINDKFQYERFSSDNVLENFWKFLHCNKNHLGYVQFSIPNVFEIKSLLGSGANAMVYRISYNNIEYAMKISNKMSRKEYDIVQQMKGYMNISDLDYKTIEIDVQEDFILSYPVGTMIKNDDICKKKYIIQILKQLAIGQKTGYVHRDIRINNIILDRNDYAYLIDWNSSTFNGFKGEYEGAFITASTPVLKQYSSSNDLQIHAGDSMADDIIYDRREILENKAILPNETDLLNYKKEVIDCLYEIELERENLTNIDDLYKRCMKLIEAMLKYGLVS